MIQILKTSESKGPIRAQIPSHTISLISNSNKKFSMQILFTSVNILSMRITSARFLSQTRRVLGNYETIQFEQNGQLSILRFNRPQG